jgi:uncharacterized protein
MSRRININWGDNQVSGVLEGKGPNGILLAHGAGTDQDHPNMVSIRSGLAEAGHTVLSFNYPYSERGSKRPDRTERLVECHRAAADSIRSAVDFLFLAGRSMGGRMGTYLAAEGYSCDGLILYAYPLHPAGKPESLRVAHLSDIAQPMLFFQGTRDPLSRTELFNRYVVPLPNVTVEVLEGANHGFTGGGWTAETLIAKLVEGTTRFVTAISSGKSPGTTA